MVKDNYFSYDNIEEIAEFDSHLDFVTKLIDKYRWKKAVKDSLLNRLGKIQEKQKDKTLNISVVGEFSTGKSTFINALMRNELLSVCSLQGTTVAETVLEYSRKYEIMLQYINGRQKTVKCIDFDSLRTALEEYTTEPEKAKNIRAVRVRLPSKRLESAGFRIIDTPGTNAIELWHEEVTKRALTETSDLSIVLIDANKQLPESFCNFVRENLAYILPQCIFVVTKLDLVREKERKRVLEYIKVKLEQTFDLINPLVFPYVSIDVVEDFNRPEEREESSPLLQQSYESEEKILTYAGRYRLLAQAKKLVSLIDNMYDAISEQMIEITKGQEEELALLLRSRQADLTSFVEQQKQERLESFDNDMAEYRADTINILYQRAGNCPYGIYERIDRQPSSDGLKSFLDNYLSAACLEEAQTLLPVVEERYSYAHQCFKNEMGIFEENFEKLFRDLDILSKDLVPQSYVPPEKPVMTTADVTMASDYVLEQVKKENRVMGGGAAAGAVIGTAIAPGVGTVVGGLIGMFSGSFFGLSSKLDKVKTETKEKLSIPLKNYFERVIQMVMDSIDGYTREIRGAIPQELSKYLTAYQSEIERRIAKEEEKKTAIEKQLDEIRKDMKDIENRKFRLDSISSQFDALSKERDGV